MPPLSSNPTENIEPWYRQFWLWFLIALPASVVIASFFTIKLALDSGDAVVRDDYYKDGLAINESLARDQRAIELGIRGVLELSAEGIALDIEGTNAEHISAVFRHPFDAKLDAIYDLTKTGAGDFYRTSRMVPLQRWYIELSAAEEAQGQESAVSWRIQAEQDFRNSSSLVFGE